MSNPSEELAFQTERAEKAEAELETFKREAKELEEFLESEATKKEAEIRKLKEEAIMKEKNFKLQKMQFAQLQAENAALKEHLASAQTPKPDPSLQAKLEGEVQALRKAQQELRKQVQRERQRATASEAKAVKIQQQSKGRQGELKEEIEQLRRAVEQADKRHQELKKSHEELKRSGEELRKAGRQKESEIERKSSKKEMRVGKERAEEGARELEESNQRLREGLAKSEKAVKQLKAKNQSLYEQNEQLHSKILNYSKINTVSQASFSSSPFTIKPIAEELEPSRLHYSCLLLTKPHYISPFLEVLEDRSLLKIYKSTRAGTFEKSVGYSKHRFDTLSFDQEQLVEPIVKSVLESENGSHSIVLFGVKKSSKKYIMARIVSRLKEFLMGRLEQDEHPSCVFIKRSQEEEKNSEERGETRERAREVIDRVIGLGSKGEKGKERGGKKGQAKPKVRYFRVRAGEFSLEVGTSSYTGLAFREKMTATSMLNNILYSKLPDVLQSALSQKYLVLTLNPIVDLYEDCRNTLSTTLCRAVEPREEEGEWRPSPLKEELNETAKKKLESIERESEQTSIRMRRLEEDCSYYRSRFDELEFRLKNLLNTHAGQNSYLKKSPITLSYEKLLKFVHSVQGRSGGALNSSQYGSASLLKHSNLHTEKEDLDAL